MMRGNNDPKNEKQVLLDPEPISIALGVLGALASIGAVFFQKAVDDERDERARREYVRNALYGLHRSLIILEGTVKHLASYASQYDFWNTRFRLGQVHFWVDESTLLEIRKIYADIYAAGLALSESTMVLAGHLDDDDFSLTTRYAEEIDSLIFGAMTSDDYRSFIMRSSRLIIRLENLVSRVGQKYDFNPPAAYAQ